MNAIDLTQLSPEERKRVMEQAKELEKAEKEKKLQDREVLKQMSASFVSDLFPVLENASSTIKHIKNRVFDSAEKLIDLKADCYGVKSTQKSHTFSDSQGRTITLGHRVVDRYDDTVNEGVALVREYVKTLAINEETADLVDTVLNLLKVDKEGNLKPSRILELNQLCIKRGNPEKLREGIDIIQSSYKPEKTCQFVEVSYIDEKGKKQSLPLSMSAID
ncbi:DUF3164 family protein [Bacteroidales bacterium OttesenSCG-928-C19]|nr:DUF3164 family protein [Bacteroidales bacterium OttesenSCG-928-C19]